MTCLGGGGVVGQERLVERRASRQLGVQLWAPHWGDRAWDISVLGRPCHPDWLGRMLRPGSPTLPVCTSHSHSRLPWRSPRPSAFLGYGVRAHWVWQTGCPQLVPALACKCPALGCSTEGSQVGRELLMLPPHARVPPVCPDSLGERSPYASNPSPTGQSRAARQPLCQLAWALQGMEDAVPVLGLWPWWSLGQCLEDILLAKSPCWLGGFKGAAEHLGSSPGKDFAAGYASCRQQFRGIWDAQDCHFWAWAATQGWGA